MSKNMKWILIASLLQGCTVAHFLFDPITGGSESDSDPQTPGGSAGLYGMKAVDASNEELGFVIGADNKEMLLINSFGYSFTINWEGTVEKITMYYRTSDCTGITFFNTGSDQWRGKMALFDGDGNPFKPKNITALGLAVKTVESNLNSYKSQTGTCSSNSGSGDVIEMEATSRSAIGLPGSISGPITLEENE